MSPFANVSVATDAAFRGRGYARDLTLALAARQRGVVAIAAGVDHTVALKANGAVVAEGAGAAMARASASSLAWAVASA